MREGFAGWSPAEAVGSTFRQGDTRHFIVHIRLIRAEFSFFDRGP